jgi:protein Tex
MNIPQIIAKNLNIQEKQATAAITLLSEGASVPFIARYRKEQTFYLDDQQLRELEVLWIYYQELVARKEVILKSLIEQDKLSDELKQQIENCTQKQLLEDIYAPFKPKRRNKAAIAKEQGLEPLAIDIATHLLDDQALELAAQNYIKDDLDQEAVLNGARDILVQNWSENAELVQKLRDAFAQQAMLESLLNEEKKELDTQEKFLDYYSFSQNLFDIPSHRLLALLRGQEQGILQLKISYPYEEGQEHPLETILKDFYQIPAIKDNGKNYQWLNQAMRWTWKVKLQLSLEQDILNSAKETAEKTAIDIFATNLKNLLMMAPAGAKTVLGLDPGFRTGVKAAVINAQGDVLKTHTLFMHTGTHQHQQAQLAFLEMISQHQVELIAIGNGTASRETDVWVAQTLALAKITCPKVIVNEAGASIYSASELASKELEGLDVSLRGAVSIARRLQDPLAELVKITPESIGVGQYQHDVNQQQLKYYLERVVQDCVNAVGVDVNTASPALLTYISGLNSNLAQQIVNHRQKNGPFKNRKQLKDVPRLGDKTFEQAAGFLRIQNGDEGLDASSVHPESYTIAYEILKDLNLEISMIGKVDTSKMAQFKQQKQNLKQKYGLIVDDILQELEKPARDPRPEFLMAKLDQNVQTITDLKVGQKLQGTVTNVAAFGAFIDIGVHQDGLVHISHICDDFIDDIHQKVKVGQIVDVYVLDVDVARKRISLSIKKPTITADSDTHHLHKNQNQQQGAKNSHFAKKSKEDTSKTNQNSGASSSAKLQNTAMADQLKALLKR